MPNDSAQFAASHMAQLILDYIKAILSPQVIAGAVGFTLLALFRNDFKALLLRVAKIRLPGGTEVSTSQIAKTEESRAEDKPAPKPPAADPPPSLPSSLDERELDEVKELLEPNERELISGSIAISTISWPITRSKFSIGLHRCLLRHRSLFSTLLGYRSSQAPTSVALSSTLSKRTISFSFGGTLLKSRRKAGSISGGEGHCRHCPNRPPNHWQAR